MAEAPAGMYWQKRAEGRSGWAPQLTYSDIAKVQNHEQGAILSQVKNLLGTQPDAISPELLSWYNAVIGTPEKADEVISSATVKDAERTSTAQSSNNSYNNDMASSTGMYPAGTVLIRDDGQTFIADGTTKYGKSYKVASNQSGQSQTTQTSAPALGTPEYTNYLVEQGAKLGMDLSQYQVPTNASGVSTSSPINFPTITPSTGNISSATAGTAGLSELLTQQLAALDKERQSIVARQEESQSWLANFLSDQNSVQETREQAENAAGVNSSQYFADQQSRIAEIESLTTQYNSIEAAMEQQIAQTYGTFATTDFLNNQVAQIRRNAAPQLNRLSAEINSKAATLQALQGNFDRAQEYINQAVQDATADYKNKLDAFSMFYKMNQDTLTRLDTQYQNAFTKAYDLAKMEYENELQLKQTLADLQLKNPQVSINLNGTLDAAISAIRLNPAADKGEIFGSADSGYFERYYDEASNTYRTRPLGGVAPSSNGGVSNSLITDAQAYLDGVLEDDDFKDKNYLKSVKLKANEMALAANEQPEASNERQPLVVRNSLGQVVYDQSKDPLQKNRFTGSLIGSQVRGFFSNLFGD